MLRERIKSKQITGVVFIVQYNHHSSTLTWYKVGAEVVRLGESTSGDRGRDRVELVRRLGEFSKYIVKISSFSACSSVSGVYEDNVSNILLCGSACLFGITLLLVPTFPPI